MREAEEQAGVFDVGWEGLNSLLMDLKLCEGIMSQEIQALSRNLEKARKWIFS